jgi:hypothetical protein
MDKHKKDCASTRKKLRLMSQNRAGKFERKRDASSFSFKE